MRTEIYNAGVLVEWFGVDGTDWVHWLNGAEVDRHPATAEQIAADQRPTPDALAAARAELDRIVYVATAPDQLATVNALALQTEGIADGQEWRQPTGAHEAYPQGFTVAWAGKTWTSTVPANVWEPGVANWTQVTTGGPAEWVQPSGATDAYAKGAIVTHNSKTWTSTVDANVWEPGVFGWTANA